MTEQTPSGLRVRLGLGDQRAPCYRPSSGFRFLIYGDE